MHSFEDAIDRVARRHKTIAVYDAGESDELAAQFGTRNATVVSEPLPAGHDRGFVVVTEGEEFVGATSLDTLDALTSPPIVPPWERDFDELGRLWDLLDDVLFASFDRRQMLATAREIEDRAWRTGRGTLVAGFQRPEAMAAQIGVYRRLAARGDLDVHLLVHGDWDRPQIEGATVHATSAGEIGDFWVVLFDGGGDPERACGLVAEEREPGTYYGFWTYEPDLVDDLVAYVREAYVE